MDCNGTLFNETYTDKFKAASACWENENCTYIADNNCDEQNFTLCDNETTPIESNNSCLYAIGIKDIHS